MFWFSVFFLSAVEVKLKEKEAKMIFDEKND